MGANMNFEDRIEEMFLDIPEAPLEGDSVVNACASGKLLFISGQLPLTDGRLAFKGRAGLEITLDQARLAVRAAVIQALAVARKELGSLNKIKKIVHLSLNIATGAEFKDHKKVLASAMDLIHEVFGPHGRPASEVAGCASLPDGASVELSLVIEIK